MDSLRQKLIGLVNATKRKKPYRCEVEYVESTEKDAFFPLFPTDNIVDSTTSWEVRLSFNNVSSTGQLMGFGYSGNNRYNLGIESSKFRFAYSTNWFDAAIATPDTNPHTWKLEPVNGKDANAYIDGQVTSTTASSDFGAHEWFIGVGGRSTSNNQIQSGIQFGWKLYYSKIWKAGKLVTDVIPVIDWDDKPCLYDRISGKLIYATIRYTLETGGEYATITAGREIHKVDYLESTENAKQWIDTGYNVNTATDEIELDFQFLSNTIYKWIFGDHYGTSRLAIGSGDGETKRNLAYGTSTYKIADKYIFNTKHHYKIDTTGAYIDGDKLANYSSFTGSANLYLFTINIASTDDYTANGKIWRYKHKRNGVYLRDMYPAIDENGVGFMFDIITHTIFDNKGTGEGFKYPPVQLEYLESTDGHNYIDTGLNYFADYEIGIKLRNNLSNKALGNAGTNCMERNNATTHVWRFTSSNAWDSDIDILEYHVMKWKENKIYADDVLLTEKVKNKGTTQMILFGAGSYFPNMIYFCKLWNPDDGTLVRNFVPVYMNGKAGMYDKVNKEFYDNAGTGTFSVGKIKEK